MNNEIFHENVKISFVLSFNFLFSFFSSLFISDFLRLLFIFFLIYSMQNP